jgi:hypothetical protein
MSTTAVLDRLLDPVALLLTPEVAERFVQFQADAGTQARLDELAAKANEGELNEAERHEYETYVSAIDLVTVLQAKARTVLQRRAIP